MLIKSIWSPIGSCAVSLIVLALLTDWMSGANAAEALIGTACSGSVNATDWDTIAQCSSSTFQRVSPFLAGSGGIAIGTTGVVSGTVLDMGSSNTSSILLPVGSTTQEPSTAVAGMLRYNSTNAAPEYYNGYAWLSLASGGAPAGTGYIVLSATHTGNLGGLTGANAQCLTDLTSHTNWWGYKTAYNRGILVSSHVLAFLCDGTNCNEFNANTTYYFANVQDSTSGGASFTTNSSGYGPNDNVFWGIASHMGGIAAGGWEGWWTGRGTGTSTDWDNTMATNNCNAWTNSTSSYTGEIGQYLQTGTNRWNYGAELCSLGMGMLCIVNP